jgi:hypothetical protein
MSAGALKGDLHRQGMAADMMIKADSRYSFDEAAVIAS